MTLRSRRRFCTTPSRIQGDARRRKSINCSARISASWSSGLTKLKKWTLSPAKPSRRENLRKLLPAIADDVRVLLVKLADRLHNMRTLRHIPPDARRRNADRKRSISSAPLAGRIGMFEMRQELEDARVPGAQSGCAPRDQPAAKSMAARNMRADR